MSMDRLASLGMGFQWHASIRCTMSSRDSVVVANLHYIERAASQYLIAVAHHVDPYTLVALSHRPPFLACSSQLYFDIATKNTEKNFCHRVLNFSNNSNSHASNFQN